MHDKYHQQIIALQADINIANASGITNNRMKYWNVLPVLNTKYSFFYERYKM